MIYHIKLDTVHKPLREETKQERLARWWTLSKSKRNFLSKIYKTRKETPEGEASRTEALERVAKLNRANK